MIPKIQVACPNFSNEEINEIKKTLKTSWVAPGPQTKKLELLMPAGDFEKLKFAYAYGADATYV